MMLKMRHLNGMSNARMDKKTAQISAMWKVDAVMMESTRDKTRHLIFGRLIPRARSWLLLKSPNMVQYTGCSMPLYIYIHVEVDIFVDSIFSVRYPPYIRR